MADQSVVQIHSPDSEDVLSIGVSSRLIYEGSPCDAFPCWNGGTCVELRRKKTQNGHKMNNTNNGINFICKCTQYFSGQHCEQKKLPIARNCPEKIVCPPGTFCWPELFGECIPSRTEVAADKQQREAATNDCPLACQNGGICLRLGTAPGHLECLCPSNFAGPLCQFPSTISAPILPGLILLSLLLFLLAILLILCHGPASAGFFLQIGRRRGRKDSRKWPLLELEENRGEIGAMDEEDAEWEESEFGRDNSLEMRECRPSASTFLPSSDSPQSSVAIPFSRKNAISMQKGRGKCATIGFGDVEENGGGGPSKIVHI